MKNGHRLRWYRAITKEVFQKVDKSYHFLQKGKSYRVNRSRKNASLLTYRKKAALKMVRRKIVEELHIESGCCGLLPRRELGRKSPMGVTGLSRRDSLFCPVAGLLILLFLFGSPPFGHGQLKGPTEASTTETIAPDKLSLPRILNRQPDPIIIEGKWLPELVDTEIAALRLYIIEKGGFKPIRFQVDERTDEGDWIFPFGNKSNGWRSNGRLDHQDVILFMAKDAGDQASAAARPPGALSLTTIQLTDPLDGRQAWVYLASHQEPLPSLCPLPDYVHYNHEKERLYSLCIDEEFIITEEGLHTSFYHRQATPVSGGGTGENFVDRLKFRVEVRFFFNLVPINITEEAFLSDIVAYIGGPIRSLRRQEQFIRLPLGFHAFRSYADIANYESVGIVPIEIRIPRGVHRVVSSALIQYGTDFDPAVIGSFSGTAKTRNL